MAGDALDKLKSGINKSITAINLKTSAVLEKTKIKTHISTLSDEIDHYKIALGTKIFEAWNAGTFQLDMVLEELQTIKDKYEQIDLLQTEYQQVDEKERNVLGNNLTAQEEISTYTCVHCGSVYKNAIKFCTKCGEKMG